MMTFKWNYHVFFLFFYFQYGSRLHAVFSRFTWHRPRARWRVPSACWFVRLFVSLCQSGSYKAAASAVTVGWLPATEEQRTCVCEWAITGQLLPQHSSGVDWKLHRFTIFTRMTPHTGALGRMQQASVVVTFVKQNKAFTWKSWRTKLCKPACICEWLLKILSLSLMPSEAHRYEFLWKGICAVSFGLKACTIMFSQYRG